MISQRLTSCFGHTESDPAARHVFQESAINVADFLETTLLPVVSHEVASLPPSLADKLWKGAADALLCADLTDVPTHLDTSNLSGLLEVWTTHAADNFSVQCVLH
jgi:hypothetical protein